MYNKSSMPQESSSSIIVFVGNKKYPEPSNNRISNKIILETIPEVEDKPRNNTTNQKSLNNGDVPLERFKSTEL